MTTAEIPTAYAVSEDEETGEIELSNNMTKCYSLSITVKWLAWIDFLFSLLYAFGNLYFAIPILISYFGYLGAKNFNKRYTATYLSYICIINVLRFTLFLELFLAKTGGERNNSYVGLSLVTICTFIELWVARIIYRFYISMKMLSSHEITYLREVNTIQEYYVTMW